MSKYQPYVDLSDSPVLSAYAQQMINQLEPTLYSDIYEMLTQVSLPNGDDWQPGYYRPGVMVG
jgi:hypothetical protein